MKRLEKIHASVIQYTKSISNQLIDSPHELGMTAEVLSEIVAIKRNAVSQDLNALHREGQLIKIKTRPVLFLDFTTLKEQYDFAPTSLLFTSYEEFHHSIVNPARASIANDDPFNEMIGATGSLREIISKAKAAVLYPPNGLHVLMTGPSGVGKTKFAEFMHAFASQNLTDRTEVPFVYFNCAEYYNNPELLTAQLFGYKKGTFTGAVTDRDGLIKKADGGFLFLDEIHRLTAEGQEKLFTLLDKGVFQKLGGSHEYESASIRFIGATTEDLNHEFLRTFLRRIQVVLPLPALADRPAKERLEIICHFLLQESIKIKKPVWITKSLMQDFMSRPLDGNIGELKSDIQFICAQAFMNTLTGNRDTVLLDDRFQTGIDSTLSGKAKEMIEKLYHQTIKIEINESVLQSIGQTPSSMAESRLSNFYELLMKEYEGLKSQGLSFTETRILLENKIHTLFKYSIHADLPDPAISRSSESAISKKVDRILAKIEEELETVVPPTLRDNFYLHIYSFLSYNKRGITPPVYNNIPFVGQGMTNSAIHIGEFMSQELSVAIPKGELVFLSLFMHSILEKKPQQSPLKKRKIVLVSHGNSTATSMADFANALFETNLILAIDMPINQTVSETLRKTTALVAEQTIDELILCVDMGSLAHFGQVIYNKFQVPVLTFQYITTAALLTLVQHESYESLSLSELDETMKNFQGLSSTLQATEIRSGNTQRVLYTSCITGIGTAEKIKQLIESTFQELWPEDLIVKAMEYHAIQTEEKILASLQDHESLVGIVGTFQINTLTVPFISLEELFSDHGIELLMTLLEIKDPQQETTGMKSRFVSNLSLQSVIEYLTVLNPQLILEETELCLDQICEELHWEIANQIRLRFLIHSSCMVERIVVNKSPYSYTISPNTLQKYNREFSVIKSAFSLIEKKYHLDLPDSEMACILELLTGRAL